MFDSMPARSRWGFPLSVVSHLAVVGLIVGASLMVSVSMDDPPSFILFLTPAAPPPPPPPLPPLGSESNDNSKQQIEEIEPELEEIVQPREEILEEVPEVEEVGSDDATGDDGERDGVLWGERDGDPLGERDGRRDGVPNGSPEGLGSAEEGPIVVAGEVTSPVLKHKLEPEYPEIARRARLEGQVILAAVISASGKVVEVTVVRSSNPLFDEAAIEAVEQWEYEPARQRGRPVAVFFTIDVRFSLR